MNSEIKKNDNHWKLDFWTGWFLWFEHDENVKNIKQNDIWGFTRFTSTQSTQNIQNQTLSNSSKAKFGPVKRVCFFTLSTSTDQSGMANLSIPVSIHIFTVFSAGFPYITNCSSIPSIFQWTFKITKFIFWVSYA